MYTYRFTISLWFFIMYSEMGLTYPHNPQKMPTMEQCAKVNLVTHFKHKFYVKHARYFLNGDQPHTQRILL